MIESIICWFLGHQPSENTIELGLEDFGDAVITLCERCDEMIIFDSDYGWIKW